MWANMQHGVMVKGCLLKSVVSRKLNDLYDIIGNAQIHQLSKSLSIFPHPCFLHRMSQWRGAQRLCGAGRELSSGYESAVAAERCQHGARPWAYIQDLSIVCQQADSFRGTVCRQTLLMSIASRATMLHRAPIQEHNAGARFPQWAVGVGGWQGRPGHSAPIKRAKPNLCQHTL